MISSGTYLPVTNCRSWTLSCWTSSSTHSQNHWNPIIRLALSQNHWNPIIRLIHSQNHWNPIIRLAQSWHMPDIKHDLPVLLNLTNYNQASWYYLTSSTILDQLQSSVVFFILPVLLYLTNYKQMSWYILPEWWCHPYHSHCTLCYFSNRPDQSLADQTTSAPKTGKQCPLVVCRCTTLNINS